MKRILSTKQLDETAIELAMSLGLQIDCINFTDIIHTSFDAKEVTTDFDAVGFTSYNAVVSFFNNPHAKELIGNKPVYALSGRTSEELIRQGITIERVSPDGVSLAKEVIWNKLLKAVLHVCGNLVMEKMGQKIEAFKIRYHRLQVYKTVLTPKHIERKYDAVLFFSPSGVESFLQHNELSLNTLSCCVGNTTAEALHQRGINFILSASTPSSIAMINMLAEWYKLKMENAGTEE